MCSGGDVGPLGPDGVTQIHGLFRWAKVSRRGVLLFIDEAEAFLGSRADNGMSEGAHNALNALLYNTGGERRDFMLVLATNRAEDLDAAVLDRCDESLLFDLPDEKARMSLLELYFDKYVVQAAEDTNRRESRWFRRLFRSTSKPLSVSSDRSWVSSAASKTAGFSGRELAKVMIAVQSRMFGGCEGVVDASVVKNVIEIKVREHKDKTDMMKRA